MTLIPAYGRDYKSMKEVKTAFDGNVEFLAQSIDGSGYTTKRELAARGVKSVTVRYKKLAQVCILKTV